MSQEIFEQCSSNLAPGIYITKETGWHPLCHCQDNTHGSSLFLSKTKYHSLLSRLLGISVLINTGPAAKPLSWQCHNGWHFVSFVINISGANFEEHCLNISRDILDSVFLLFAKWNNFWRRLFPHLHNTVVSVSISKTKKR